MAIVRRWFRLLVRWLSILAVAFFIFSILSVLLFKFLNPPLTPLMLKRCAQQVFSGVMPRLNKDWVPIEDISPWVVRAAVAAEDDTFMEHFGFDFKAIRESYEQNLKGRSIRGASTITQQTCKNLFLWENRTYVRKVVEAYYTILVEVFWSKKRILEVYLNIIEMGDGIYGIERAARTYYSKPAKKLTPQESAMIVAIFPSPRKRDPRHAGSYLLSRQQQILRAMYRIGPVEFEKK